MRLQLTLMNTFICLFVASTVHAQDATELLMMIQSPATSEVDRANAFEKIGDIAGAAAVEPLTGFLGDKKWSHYARFALQKMEGDNVTEALFRSLDTLEGDLQLGVIDTIGRRGDAIAVARLSNLLAHADAKMVAAAAAALGAIGTTEAAQILTAALDAEKQPGRRESLASSILLVGQRLARAGNTEAAIDVFDRLRTSLVPRPYQIGATQNAILTRGADGVELMVEQLRSPDDDGFQTGLAVARVLPGSSATEAIADSLQAESLTDRQVLTILALKDRGDRQALPAILEKLGSSDSREVQTAAIEATGKLGDASSVSTLISIANVHNADTVLEALVVLQGSGVNDVLFKAAQPPDISTVAVKALGRRRAQAAVPLLLKLSKSDSAEVSQEAIVALGLAATQERFLDLFSLLKTAQTAERKQAIQKAIHAAVFRSTQPDACAEALGSMIPGSSGADREFLFEQIRTAGGAKAVALMETYAVGPDTDLQDAATQTLGRWLSADAAPVLMQVAQGNGKYANRALLGYIRVFRQFDLPESERVAMASQALQVAGRPDERNVAIEALIRFPCVASFELALEQLDVSESEEAAANAVLTIGQTVMALDPEKGQAGIKRLIEADVKQSITESAKGLLR